MVSNIAMFKGNVIVQWAPVLSLLVSLKLASLSWAISTLSRTITLIYPFSSRNPFNLRTASLHKQSWRERLFIFWSAALACSSGCEKLATWLEYCGFGSIQTPFGCSTLNNRLWKFDHVLIVSNGILVIWMFYRKAPHVHERLWTTHLQFLVEVWKPWKLTSH